MSSQRIPEIYGVYLLQSIQKPQSFYIGSTPHPLRRLRQHNGVLARGGAFRTRKKRPWRMVVFVNRFPSKVSALQFEHAWQHPHGTRYLKSAGFDKGRALKSKLGNLVKLMLSNGFNRLGLKLTVFNKDVINELLKTPQSTEVEIENFDNYEIHDVGDGNYIQLKEFMKSEIDTQLKFQKRSIEAYKVDKMCQICSSSIDKHKLIGVCIKCSELHHLDCWYNQSLKTLNKIKQVIPITSKCSKCLNLNSWNLIVRNSLSIKDKIQ